MMGAKNGLVTERVWNHVNKTDGCWEWTGTRDQGGYGVITNGRRTEKRRSLRAHRVAWESVHGEIADGMVICHRCDNPACIRPDHLFVGTQADNVRDSVGKGRRAVGENNGNSRFTPDDVRRIRARHADGETILALAREYGAAFNAVWRIVRGKAWRHVQ